MRVSYEKYNDLLKKHKELQKEFEQYKKEAIKWSIEDFIEYEIDDDEGTWTITEEQAQKALEEMIRECDSSIGINWDVVREYYMHYAKFTKK